MTAMPSRSTKFARICTAKKRRFSRPGDAEQTALEDIARMKKASQALTALVTQLKKSNPNRSARGRGLSIPTHSLSCLYWRGGGGKLRSREDRFVGSVGDPRRHSMKGSPQAPVRSVRTGKVGMRAFLDRTEKS